MKTTYDFAPVLKGRSHYSCEIANVSVEQAPCTVGFVCGVKAQCPYFIDRDSAFTSDYAVFNYQLYMHQLEFNDKFEKPDLLVCDEAHMAHGELGNYISAEITEREIAYEGWRRPLKLDVESLGDWATQYLPDVEAELKYARAQVFVTVGSQQGTSIKGTDRQYKKVIKRYNRLQALARALRLFYRAGLDTEAGKPWISDSAGLTYKVRPVVVDDHGAYLFSDIPKVVLMSATINKRDIERLGITDYEFLEVDSNYDAARRPIYYRPVAAMSAKTESRVFDDVVDEIDTIIDGHLRYNHKGIVHTVSYDRAQRIYASSKHKALLLIHSPKNKDEVIEQFKTSATPVVLLSPSVVEGEDFPYDQCRFIIIPKVPYLSLGDEVVRERLTLDPKWYSWKAVQDIIQGSGRGMRNEQDFCSVYILDSMFEKIAREHWQDIPQWFRDAVKYLEIS